MKDIAKAGNISRYITLVKLYYTCISSKSEIDVFLTNDDFLKELFEKELAGIECSYLSYYYNVKKFLRSTR